MAIPKFLEDLNIIARLGNKPGTDDGLSDAGFKAKFDEGILKIQSYINNVLIPGIENAVSEDGLLSQINIKLAEKLSLDGGAMRGPLNMNYETLSGIETPFLNDHAANKEYVDETKNNLVKYIDEKKLRLTVTLTPNNWTGNAAPYTQSISAPGISGKDEPHYGPVYSEDFETKKAEKDAWTLVDDLDTEEDVVIFTCFEEKPTVNLNVHMEVYR